MADWRKIEAELIQALDAAGVEVIRESGDAYAVVLSIEDCGNSSSWIERLISMRRRAAPFFSSSWTGCSPVYSCTSR